MDTINATSTSTSTSTRSRQGSSAVWREPAAHREGVLDALGAQVGVLEKEREAEVNGERVRALHARYKDLLLHEAEVIAEKEQVEAALSRLEGTLSDTTLARSRTSLAKRHAARLARGSDEIAQVRRSLHGEYVEDGARIDEIDDLQQSLRAHGR